MRLLEDMKLRRYFIFFLFRVTFFGKASLTLWIEKTKDQMR